MVHQRCLKRNIHKEEQHITRIHVQGSIAIPDPHILADSRVRESWGLLSASEEVDHVHDLCCSYQEHRYMHTSIGERILQQ